MCVCVCLSVCLSVCHSSISRPVVGRSAGPPTRLPACPSINLSVCQAVCQLVGKLSLPCFFPPLRDLRQKSACNYSSKEVERRRDKAANWLPFALDDPNCYPFRYGLKCAYYRHTIIASNALVRPGWAIQRFMDQVGSGMDQVGSGICQAPRRGRVADPLTNPAPSHPPRQPPLLLFRGGGGQVL